MIMTSDQLSTTLYKTPYSVTLGNVGPDHSTVTYSTLRDYWDAYGLWNWFIDDQATVSVSAQVM